MTETPSQTRPETATKDTATRDTATRNQAVPARGFVRHVVFFSARDRADIPKIVEGLSILGRIPHSSHFEVVVNSAVDALSSETDAVVYAEFADHAALAAYKADPIYQESIDLVRPLRAMRVAADF